MAILSFKVQADYEKVVRLREEITRLENQLKSFGRNTPLTEIKAVEAKLAETRTEFTSLATEAAKAGAVMSTDFKGRIHAASQTVNSLTEKIIEQKAVIRNVEFDVKKLADAYRNALKGSNTSGASEIKADLDAARKALDEEKAALFGLTQEKAKASLETKKLKDEYAAFKEEAGETKKANDGFTLSLGKIAGLVGGAAALKQLGSAIVQVRGQFQDMETAISTLVGQDMADRLMPQLKEMAKVSPLTMTDIVGAEKMMLGFNIEADKTIDYLKALSDVSMGSSQKFNSLTLAFSQMSAAGRLTGQDLNQMINAGFNPLQVISEKTGKSIAQLKEEMSKGAVSAEMVQQAFLDATSAGGKFYNMSENASKTINGQISMMQDAMDSVFNEIGTKTEGVIVKGIKAATSLIQNYEKIGKVLVGLVATYGAYRTAVLLSTAATSKHTIAEIALTNVRIAARKAQQALNAAMLTNPYVALATVVAGLAATMWTLRDNTSAAERAQKDFDSRKEDAARKEQEHRNAIQGLIDTARDDVKATREREAALVALKNEYPNIFNEYDIESLKLTNLIDLNKALNEEMNRRKKAEAARGIEYRKSLIRQMEDMGISNKRIEVERKRLKKDEADYLKQYSLPDYISSLKGMDMAQLQKELGGAQHMASGSGVGIFDGMQADRQFYEDMVKAIETEIAGRNKTVTTYAQDYEAARKKYEEDLAAFKYAEEHKTEITTEEYRKRKTAMETSEKEFKRLGGDPKGKTESDAVKTYNENLAQQEKVEQAEAKSAKDRARTAKDMEFMVEQARIDAMREGSEKVRAQRTLDNAKELENLERQKQDYIDKVVEQENAVFDAREEQKAKNDKNYKRQTFDSEAARKRIESTDSTVKQYDTALGYTRQKQDNETLDAERSSWNKYLQEYGSYLEKKKAIAEDYDRQIEAAETRGDRAMLVGKKRDALADLDFEQFKESGTMSLAFGDVENLSKDTVSKLIDDLEKYRDKAVSTFDAASLNEYEDALARLKMVQVEQKGWGVSEFTPEWFQQRKSDMNELNRLEQTSIDLDEKKKQKQEERKKKQEELLDIIRKQTGIEAGADDLAKGGFVTGAIDTATKYGTDADAIVKASAELDVIDAELKDVEVASENATNKFEAFRDATGKLDGEKVGAAIQSVTDTISDVAGKMGIIIDSISGTMDALGANTGIDSAIGQISEGFDIAVTSVTGLGDAAAQFASGNILGGITSLASTIGSVVQKIAAWKDAERQLNIDKLAESNEALDKSYDSLAKSISKAFSADASNLIEQQNTLLEQKKANLQLMIAEEQAKKNVDDDQVAAWLAQIEEIDNTIQDNKDSAVEALAGQDVMSAIDSFANAYADAWANGEDAAEASVKATRNMLRNALTEYLKGELSDEVEAFNKKLADAMKDGIIDPWEEAQLDALREKMDSEAQNYYEQTSKYWEDEEMDDSQQTASRKGYETLSEDTGNELVGRAVAQYESNLRMEESMRAVKDSVDIMSAGQVQIRDIAAESRAIIADSFLELQQIRENTGAIIKPINEMNQRTKDWDNIIRSL